MTCLIETQTDSPQQSIEVQSDDQLLAAGDLRSEARVFILIFNQPSFKS